MNIKTKILFPTITLTLLVAAAILISNIVLFSGFVDASTVSLVNSATKVAIDRLDSLKERAKAVSLSIAKDPVIVNALESRNRDGLLAHAGALQHESGIEFCTITDSEGRALARTHAPEQFGDSVASQLNIQSAFNGETLAAVEEGSVIRMSVRSGAPVLNDDGAIIGVVSVGFRLDTDKFVDELKAMMGCEINIVLGDERIATTVLMDDGSRAIGTRADKEIADSVLAGNSYSGRADILGRTAVSRYTPIDGPDGRPLGMLFVGQYLEEEAKTVRAFVQRGSVITLFMLLASIIIILLIVGRIVTPIRAMTDAASAMAIGDTDLDIQVNTKDEMSTLAGAFNSMIENTRKQIQSIEHIASGDLTVTLQPRSEKDIMNRALEKLNSTIRQQANALRAEHERQQLMLDATPLASRLWDKNFNLIECNEAAVKLFNLKDKQEYIDRYFELSPEYQPDGEKTSDKVKALVKEAFEKGSCTYDWVYQLPDGTPIPAESTMVRVPYGDDFVVAGYSRDLREQKKMLAEIEQRDYLLQIVNQAADILFRSEPDGFLDNLHQCMGMMARAINADRMYICKNYAENGSLYRTQLYEWSDNVQPEDTGLTARAPYDSGSPEIQDAFLRGECVNMLVRDITYADREQLSAQGILATLLVPVYIRDELWGFVGFDNCRTERLFTENEVSVMRSGSLLIANALLRNEYTLSIKDTSNQLEMALADAKEANNAKSSFLAHMSHEIRTPLNAVVGLSELILDDDKLEDELENKLEKIHASGITILSIVNNILDISKIESGKFEIYPTQYDTPSLINDIVTLNIVRIGEKPITFRLSVDENLPGVLYGDDLRVKQIFSNLLSNSFKYTDAGAVEWRVSFERDGESVWIVSSIRDTGIGIKPEGVQKLFSDYNQVDMQINRKVEGTGLGLAITKRLVEMMNGTITVESDYGHGTTFNVRLCQAFVSETPIGKTVADNLMNMRYTLSKRAKNTNLVRANLSYAHVLVVDDIVTNLDVVKGMMKPYGLKIDCAMSGRQAIEMIRAGTPRYNAVFMDHMMPEMDGVEATQIIRREIDTDYARNIPIIALTANAIVGNEEMFLEEGFQAFISKPIDMMKLDSVLRHWVRDKNLEKELEQKGQTAELPETGADNAAVGKTSLLDGITISGVDKGKAMELFSGDEEVFVEVLRSYAVNTRPLLSNLREYLATDNLEDYTIAVHGIKGSSYGISARETGKLAEGLEKAARAKNLDAVKAGHDAFEQSAETLLNNIEHALAGIGSSDEKPLAAVPDMALLQELRDACKAFDMDRVDTAMTQLESFRYEKGKKLVEWLREQVNNMAFEEISGMKLSDFPELSGLAEPEKTVPAKTDYLNFIAPEADILIVDDNETNLKAAQGLLKPLRMRIDTAENGKTALQMIQKKQYHLVFMDHLMPVMDGIETAERLRQIEGDYYRNVPVIALSANDAAEARENFLQSGMNDSVTKPIEMKEMCEKIRQWLPGELIREQAPQDIPGGGPPPNELDDLPVIEGINSKEGLRYSGSKELFTNLLGNFYKLIDLKADKIEKCLADGLIRDFTIEVHALTTTARMIGAAELSAEFSRLEKWGNEGDREALKRETPAVLQQYRSFKPILKPFGEVAEQKKKSSSGRELTSLLRKLKSAMDNFNLDGADEALKQLDELRIPEECRTQMAALRAYVADVAMEDAMNTAEAMIKIIGEIGV